MDPVIRQGPRKKWMHVKYSIDHIVFRNFIRAQPVFVICTTADFQWESFHTRTTLHTKLLEKSDEHFEFADGQTDKLKSLPTNVRKCKINSCSLLEKKLIIRITICSFFFHPKQKQITFKSMSPINTFIDSAEVL